jgi:Flp pilus assembly protein TadD
VAAIVAATAAGCSIAPKADITGSITTPSTPRSDADWHREMEEAGALYRQNPRDADVAMRYAQALREIGQRAQAAAVLEQTAIHNPNNKALLGAFGRALADAGRYETALEVLNRAHTPDQPDWRILSVQGAVLDQMGRHDEARNHYNSALRLKPNDPSVLSNLGLSYALSKNLPMAEATLRRAALQPGAAPKVRQNLALVVGLQGRFKEAEDIAKGDLSPEEAAANIAYLRGVLAQRSAINKKPNHQNSPLAPSTGT